jgi:hypothetical protein
MRVLFPITALLSAGTMLAQVAPVFPTPAYFRRQFSTPQTRVELQPPVRLRDFVVGDKLQLSLKNYLELVMANNTDIALQRLTLETPRNNLMGAFGKFDPTMRLNFNANRAKSTSTRSLDGASELSNLQQNGGITYSQLLTTGTQLTASLSDRRTSTNDAFSTFNPYHSGNLQINFTQPLLRNRSPLIQRMPITMAQSSLRKSEYDFRDQLLRLRKMGSMEEILGMIPGLGAKAKELKGMTPDETELKRVVAIIDSMTAQERRNARILNGSRRKRIAAGSGTTVQDVNRLMKNFQQAEAMIQRMTKGGMRGMGRNLPFFR